MATEQAPRPPRRAPRPDERGKTAEQTRERIIAAAVEEFGAKGYAGARTASIAARAGVNQQLIAYYFGGKQGLLEELRRRWAEQMSTAVPAGASFQERFAAYLDAALDNPNWARLILWQALGDDSGDPTGWQPARLIEAVDGVRRRQETGEITSDLDPEFVLLLAYALVFAPLTLPQFVAGIFGVEGAWADYRRRCQEQLTRLLAPTSATTPTGKKKP